MKLTSTAFKEGEMIPKKYTADGADVNPPLTWTDVPEGTQSFALICDDPDAPVGLWVHWLVCDISADTRAIAENSVPKGAKLVTNDFHRPEWGGPAPPSGVHRYFFKLYALKVPKLDKVTNKKAFYEAVEKFKLAQATLMGKYTRNR